MAENGNMLTMDIKTKFLFGIMFLVGEITRNESDQSSQRVRLVGKTVLKHPTGKVKNYN